MTRIPGFGLDAVFVVVGSDWVEMDVSRYNGARVCGHVFRIQALRKMVGAVRLLDCDATIRVRICECPNCFGDKIPHVD